MQADIVILTNDNPRDVPPEDIVADTLSVQADIVILTNDNPRDVPPEDIVADTVAGCNGSSWTETGLALMLRRWPGRAGGHRHPDQRQPARRAARGHRGRHGGRLCGAGAQAQRAGVQPHVARLPAGPRARGVDQPALLLGRMLPVRTSGPAVPVLCFVTADLETCGTDVASRLLVLPFYWDTCYHCASRTAAPHWACC